MTLGKFIILLVSFTIIGLILGLQLRYVSTKRPTIDIDNTEYQIKVDSIDKLTIIIDSLQYKLKQDEVKIKALDDSNTVQLFMQLVRGE